MARLLLSVILLFTTASSLDQLRPESHVQSVVIGEVSPIVFKTEPQPYDILILFNTSDLTESLDILNTTVISKTGKGTLWVKGKKLTSQLVVDPIDCRVMGGNESKCPLDLEPAYVRLNIIQSRAVDWIADIVGWTYFFAWSISFYPQIFLNCSRKSVIGLNFDFLLLNVIGFTAYSIYNLLMFFNPFVQAEYQQTNPHSPNPVYLNDVVFAVHALIACLVTGAQCFFYERENQRVSKPCMGLGTILVLVGIVSGALSVFGVYNALIFVNSLSYIKMAVTMSKYFPQAFYNFRRKSTVGWSIGNILLDFTGGSLDILQMVLQSANVGDWRSFYGNPVKFGLGLVSIIFDIVFMIQHYILYRDVEVAHNEYAGIDNPEARGSVSSYGSQEVGDQPSARIMSAEE